MPTFPSPYQPGIVAEIQSHQIQNGSITWMLEGLARRHHLERRTCGDF